MLNPVGVTRHLAVAAAVVVAPVLALLGVLGGGRHDERFDAKQVLITPAGGEAVRLREVVDIDFGNEQRRGYQRIVPNDFGVPIDIVASSPDAPDDLGVENLGFETQIRIGNPDITQDGQHRYVLSYTLPEAQLSSGELALDVIGTDETLETGRFEVVLAGFDIPEPRCNVGSEGTTGGCQFEREGDTWVAVIEPLDAGDGLTVGGLLNGVTTPPEVAVPPIPERRTDRRVLLAAVLGVLGVGVGVGSFAVARRRGRNESAGPGGADAAFGSGTGSHLVADADLDELVTTEFVPPQGLRPWEGAALLSERVDADTVAAWFSGLIADEVIALEGTPPELRRGPRFDRASATDRSALDELFASSNAITLSSYHPELADLWSGQAYALTVRARESGWWSKYPPGTTPQFPTAMVLTMLAAIAIVAIGWFTGFLRSWPVAVAVGCALPAAVAMTAYRPLLPVRSATGTGLALRTESFRRFLEASEGRHVDWAWKHGLLREYSAWAVALGAAEAWDRAIRTSAVPPTETNLLAPMGVYWYAAALQSSRVAPAPSGGSGGGFSGGGGFSSGSVGGGGGGGSSGSW